MRNILTLSALTLTVAAFATFAGCGDRACQNSTAPSESTTNVGEQASESDASGETAPNDAVGKALVVYFSRTGEQYSVGKIDKGNTAIVAEIIAKQTGASLWEVVPEKDEYP
ncbi:MAG: hypothetical protein IK077_14870, partial [Thermoguttaceae bacterium]|nr:hypothetical protein [Thermoguttaceae bacterium]